MSDQLFDELAEKLRLAQRRVAALDVEPEVKAALTGRLLAVTNASKHDLERASTRVDALLAELDAGRLPMSTEG